MPLKAGTYHLSSPFGPRDRRMHWGQDFAANDGTPIYAAQAGSVQYIGSAQGFGQWIVIDHPAPAGGGTTVYGHMWDAFATGLKPGSSVAAGQHIAYVGSNGQSSGPHLHFEVHPTVWRAGSQIDPIPWLAGALDPETMLSVAAVPVTDTLYADVSEWQRPVDDSYPYRVIAIRSNDGTYRDKNWASNYTWCKRRCDENALVFFIVYFVWRQNWQQTVDTLKNRVGQPHPRMAVMIDVESWQGQIIGNQSDGLNKAYRAVADWLGDRRRVIAYGNRGDLNSLWPYKPVGLRIVLASYGSNPGYPGKIAHHTPTGRVTAAACRRGVRHSASAAWIPPMGSPPNSTQLPAVSVPRSRASREATTCSPTTIASCLPPCTSFC
jgi:Peptidase family M23